MTEFVSKANLTLYTEKAKARWDNKIESVKVNGTALGITDKAVNITVPTDTVTSAQLATKQDKLTFDSAPTSGSTNPVTSGGVYTSLAGKQASLSTSQLAAVNSGITGTLVTKLNGIADGANKYTLPTASSTVLGGVKIGSNITIDDNGAISVPDATAPANNATITVTAFDGTTTTFGTNDANAKTVGKAMSTAQKNAINSGVTTDKIKTYDIIAENFGSTLIDNEISLSDNSEVDVPSVKAVTTLISNIMGSLVGVSLSVVDTLPSSGDTNLIYLVSHSHGTSDIYDEYIWIEPSGSETTGKFEKIGNTDVDLSSYMKTSDISAMTDKEVSALFN